VTDTIRFPFAQFEFSHNIGPPAGRYVVRPALSAAMSNGAAAADDLAADGAPSSELEPGEDPRLGANDVIIVKVEGATVSRGRWFARSPRRAQAGDGSREVAIVVATVIRATAMMREASAARDFFLELRSSGDERERWVNECLVLLNRAVSAYRLCAADPYAVDLTRSDARSVRVGYGTAAEVKRGMWEEAITVEAQAAPRVSRGLRLMPTQGMAAVLGGKARTLEAEELILRAVLDVTHGRGRAGALCLEGAHELLADELRDEPLDGHAQRCFDELTRTRGAVAELAAAARQGPLKTDELERLKDLAETAGAFVDAWRYQEGAHEPAR